MSHLKNVDAYIRKGMYGRGVFFLEFLQNKPTLAVTQLSIITEPSDVNSNTLTG